MNEPIPLARPELGPREEELLLEVVRSGSLSLGPKLEQFEHDFSDWIGGEVYAVAAARTGAHLRRAVEGDPELRRVLDDVQARKLDPLSAVSEIMSKVFGIDGNGDARSR